MIDRMKTVATRGWVAAAVLFATANAWASVTPDRFETTLQAGQSDNDPIVVALPGRIPKADIVFSLDLTGSMYLEIDTVKREIVNIMTALDSVVDDARFGVVSYMDYPAYYESYGYRSLYGHSFYGDYPYRLESPLTYDRLLVKNKVAGLKMGWGADWPEDYGRIFHEVAVDPAVGFRDDAKRILINFGDAIPHDDNLFDGIYAGSASSGGDPGRDGSMFTADDLDFQTVLELLKTKGITLFHINSGYHQDLWVNWTRRTGGDSILLEDAAAIPRTVLDVLERSAADLNLVSNLSLAIPLAFQKFVASVTPSSYANLTAPTSVPFTLRLTVPAGTAAGEYTAVVKAMGDGLSYGEHTIVLTVPPEPSAPEPAPAKNTVGKVTGGGFITDAEKTVKNNFGFNVHAFADGHVEVKGQLQYVDRDRNMSFHGDAALSLVIEDNRATFTGSGRLNGEPNHKYRVEVVDNGNPGKGKDTFSIWVDDDEEDYQASGTLEGGNIKIHVKKNGDKFGADLLVSRLSTTATGCVAGARIDVVNAVKNQGKGSAGAFRVAFRLSADSAVGDDDVVLSESRTVPSLAAGATSQATSSVTVPKTTAAGRYYLCAVADAAAAVSETDEANNAACAAAMVEVSQPDLIPLSVTPAASSAAKGVAFQVAVGVKNQGKAASGASTIAFRLSTNPVHGDADDVEIPSTATTAPLAGGASSTVNASLKMPNNLPLGAYHVCAKVDARNVVGESDEANNALCSAAKVDVAASDLVASAPTATGAPAIGSKISVTSQVTNSGEAPAGAFKVGLFLSTDGTIDASDLRIGVRPVAGLAAGATSSATTVVTLPASMAPGTYYLGTLVDVEGKVAEKNEANNAATGAALAVQHGSDLVAVSVSAPAAAKPGASIQVRNEVANRGIATSPRFTVTIFLSTDATITAADRKVLCHTVNPLAAGATNLADSKVTLPANLPVGTYYVGVVVDADQRVKESDEGNNAVLMPLTVTATP